MSDGASRAKRSVAFIAESTRGTTPTTPAYNYQRIRSGTTFQVDKQFEQSDEIRSDREPGTRVGGVSSWSGTLNTFLVRETYLDQMLRSTFSADFAALAPSAITGDFAAAGDTFTRAAGSFFTTAGNRFELGDLVFAGGTANNQTQLNGAIASTTATSITVDTVDATTITNATGYIKIDSEIMAFSARTATTFTVTRGALGTTAATHADNAPVLIGRTITALTATVMTFGGDVVLNETAISTTFTTSTVVLVPGTTRSFGTFEQEFSDLNAGSGLFEIFKGGEVNTAQFSMPTSGQINIDFNLIGTRYATGQVASSTYTAAAGRTPFAASVTGSGIFVDSAAPAGCITNMQFTANNNRAVKFGVGEQFACFVEEGTRQIDATFGLYLVDLSNQTLFQAETRFRLLVTAVSADGDEYDFVFPRMVFTALPRGEDGETIIENASSSAEYDSTAGTAFYLRKRVLSSV